MEKSVESSSDSDSNSSTSWVFVSDNSSLVEHTPNTFHLDCSREPIQELTEQDLVSPNSDIESDTDGVSVISESDTANEENEDKTGEKTSELKNILEEFEDCETITADIFIPKKVDKSLITEAKKFLWGRNIVGVGVVLTAVFLGSCTFKKMIIQDTSDLHSQNFIVDNIVRKEHTNLLCQNVANLDEIVDITIACTYNDQRKDLIESKEIKRCVQTKYEKKNLFKGNNLKPGGNNKHLHLHLSKTGELAMDNLDAANLAKPKISHEKKNIEQLNSKKKLDKCKSKADWKQCHSQETKSKYIKLKKLKQKPTFVPKPPKIIKEKNYYKNHQQRNDKNKQNFIFTVNVKRNHSKEDKLGDSDGEWYSNLHKARHISRKQGDTLDFYINKKKIRNQWYFKWMNSREESRRKNINRPYSKYLNI